MNDDSKPDYPGAGANEDKPKGEPRIDPDIGAQLRRGASREIAWAKKLRDHIPDLMKITLSAYVVLLIYLVCFNADWYFVVSLTAITLACLVTLGVLAGKLAGHSVSSPEHIFHRASGLIQTSRNLVE